MNLVTIEQARAHLRIDGDFDDDWLSAAIPAVSQAVLLWLKDESRAFQPEIDSNGDEAVDSNGDPSLMVRPIVRMATLVELATLYRYREGEGNTGVPQHWGHGYTLSVGATALLTPLRKSTVA